jgi:hypothetical protein
LLGDALLFHGVHNLIRWQDGVGDQRNVDLLLPRRIIDVPLPRFGAERWPMAGGGDCTLLTLPQAFLEVEPEMR